MAGGRELLLLAAVIALLVQTEQKPTVSMIPYLTKIFTGDLLYLHCDSNPTGPSTTWDFNGNMAAQTNTLKIAAASSKDSGIYKCTINGQTSDGFNLEVLEYVPIASLSIATGQPVMRNNAKVLLELTNDEGLEGWLCRVNREKNTKRVKLKLNNANPTSFIFETSSLKVPETIYWCEKNGTTDRSNQVVLRTTDNEVTLEMYPFPAMAGEKMTLRCLVWGTKEVIQSVFYKENVMTKTVHGDTYNIPKVTESEMGRYRCKATYRYKDQTVSPHVYKSDVQDLPVQVRPVEAVLSDTMQCSCPSCDKQEDIKSYMYYKQNGNSWTMLGQNKHPDSDGTYHCRAVLGNMRTLPSKAVAKNPSIFSSVIGILVFIIVLGLLIFAVAFYKWNKNRNARVDIYEQVPMRQGDANYEAINMRQVKEGEYDTLQPGAEGRQKTGGEYEALTKREGKDEVYHTLGENVASGGGDGGYQALKTAGIQKDEYDTLKTKQPEGETGAESGGNGGYEALKTAGIQKDEYDTLKTKQPEGETGAESGGNGGYEALKTAGIQKDEYDTLKTKQPEGETGAESGGNGGYEALKTAGISKDEYETLKTKQAELEKVEEIKEEK
ncbi:uncharacterized protein LOC114133259 isoform X2 [Xiphophorus couchianus]|uniref:uncharacterized protein LOC114133259 isoform X2 n=1 Tax=Xiphophorus couchianus TaxID=32473 RepID=UPI001016633B|nr:uncharacterized protein LOC114133259 isoform X2 [Xiphophorus couchianus]